MVLGLIRSLNFLNVAPTHVKITGGASYYHAASQHGGSAQKISNSKPIIKFEKSLSNPPKEWELISDSCVAVQTS